MLFDASKSAGLVALLAGVAHAGYTLDSYYDANNFFDEFSFYSDPDPTHGYVDYLDGETAFGMGLASMDEGVIRLAADSTESNPANGRKSVRMESNKGFTQGLVICDIAHMPASTCGTWPAFWTFGPNWPTSGEIDIIEGVNTQRSTAVTLHTGPGCTISNEGTDPRTSLEGTDCGAGGGSVGCGQRTSSYLNYGDGFNAVRGGVYALEWTSDHIAVWFFTRAEIPLDIRTGTPNPEAWGYPVARFVGGEGCDLDEFFAENKIIINTTFCGDWAGAPEVWAGAGGGNSTCSALAPTCQDYVANNPGDFEDAYWEFNSISLYKSQ